MLRFTLYFLRTLSVLSLLYFIAVFFISGAKTSFLWFWIVCSIGTFFLSVLLPAGMKSQNAIFHFGVRIIYILLLIGFAFFFIVEAKIFFFSRQKPIKQADYVIVLGAQVRGSIPSKTLNMRIQTAYRYLKDNPNSKVICSGGQGKDEDISEARAIANGLISLGISEKRIILEENSTNTVENLKFSSEFCDKQNNQIVIVTSDFHLYRACGIAKKQGYKKISGLGAKEFMVTTPGYFIREFFAVIKDFLYKNF